MLNELIFFTSNRTKLAHAKYLCRDYNFDIISFKEKTYHAGYNEPHIDNREQLIQRSYESALEQAKKAKINPENHFFFIEDTSVIIDALSAEREFPSVNIKFWMQETSFDQLDKGLLDKNNNRKVTVRSDLILHIPNAYRAQLKTDRPYLHFIGHARGTITPAEIELETNLLYPWLDNKTFNKWFVPENCSKPISALPIDSADKYDFRAPAFQAMLDILSKNGLINKKPEKASLQKSLIFDGVPALIVCGLPCAGKTTIAHHLSTKYGYYHIEASDFMYLSYHERHGIGSDIKIGDFAMQALKMMPQIVAEQIIEYLKFLKNAPLVITGFRSLKEIEWFNEHYEGTQLPIATVIAANEKCRYNRSLNRARTDDQKDLPAFEGRDKQQLEMGISQIQKYCSDNTVMNEGTFDTFFEAFEKHFALTSAPLSIAEPIDAIKKRPETLDEAVLLTLLGAGEFIEDRPYYTTTEIAKLINDRFSSSTHKDNISRYFNQIYRPYFEIITENGKNKYRLSNTGYSKAREILIKRHP